MKRFWLTVAVTALGMIGIVAPRSASAAIDSFSVTGDCSHVEIDLAFSGANGAYQNTLISAETSSGGLAGKYVTIPDNDSISTSLSWDEVPRGTVITIYADHYIQGQGVSSLTSKSYTCGDAVSKRPALIFAPETDDRVMITAAMPVYSDTNLGSAVPGSRVEVGQDFLMVDSVVVDDITWFKIFIGGAYPWVPDLGAYTYSN